MARRPKASKVVNTTPQQLITGEVISNRDRLAAIGFQPGKSGNPAGRPKGSRTKLAETFLKDFLADWEVAGASAIQACRLEDPATYVRIAASMVPKELQVKQGNNELEQLLDQLTDEQLDAVATHGLAGLIGQTNGSEAQAKTVTRAKPNGIH